MFFEQYEKINLIKSFGSCIAVLGALIYSLILMMKKNKIVDYIDENLVRFGKFQLKMTILLSLFCSISCMTTLYFEEAAIFKQYSYSLFQLIKSISGLVAYWITFPSVLYGTMNYMMYLKNLEVLNRPNVNNVTNLLAKVNKIKENYNQFDEMVSYLPFIWILYTFFCTNSSVSWILSYGLAPLMSVTVELTLWSSTIIFTCRLRNKIQSKVEQLKFEISTGYVTDEHEKGYLILIVEQINKFANSAGPFIKLDEKYLLSFFGSIISFSFLFHQELKIDH